jgi:DMSO/TMAO reductase YedYZ molybdopterin-dependent catalytic subunit
VYGAPLRLRVENQLGYKMVKWIERIEFIEGSEIRLSRCMPAQADSPTRAT